VFICLQSPRRAGETVRGDASSMKIPVAGVFLKRRREEHLRRDVRDPWRRFRIGLGVLGGVLVAGTIGYTLLGLSAFDALYQTSITITTVGYGEIGPPDEVDGGYRAFTLVLVLVGASSAIYTVSVLLETVVEGSLNDGLRRRRMTRLIDSMDGHMVIAGWGRVGQAIAHYARRMGTDVVVIDMDDSTDAGDIPVVAGDANEDDVLLAAGLARCSVLVAALSSDAENLSLTLTARSLAPDLFLVARTSDQRHERKFFQAGADRVVNPYEIGGSRMGALALQPNVAEFLDEVLHDDSHDVEIHEVAVAEGSRLVGATIGDVAPGDGGVTAIAVRPAGEPYRANPPAATTLQPNDLVIVLGTRDQVAQLHARSKPPAGFLYRGAWTTASRAEPIQVAARQPRNGPTIS
jgi:voltage-gated potassium channel